MTLAKRWSGFWFTPEAPLNLGVCRALFYAVVLYAYVGTNFSAFGALGRHSAFWDPIWPFQAMHWPVFSPPVLEILQVVWKVSLVMACVGLLTPASSIFTFVLGTYLIGLTFNYGKVEHQTMPMIIVMGVLALSRCGAAFSLDALLNKMRGKPAPAPSGEYRWPMRVVWLLMAITFCAAGIAKLRYSGIRWATGPGFSLLLLSQHYDPNPPHLRWGLVIANHAWLAKLFAGGSLLTELLFPLALFDRRARRIFPLATFSMQLGIGLVMQIWFIQFLAIYAFWLPWGRMLAGKTEESAAPSPAVCTPISDAAVAKDRLFASAS